MMVESQGPPSRPARPAKPQSAGKTQKEALEVVNEEILTLYELLERQGLTGRQWEEVTQPLVDAVNKASVRRRLTVVCRAFIITTALLLFFYLLLQVSWVQKIGTVVFRNFLLMLLPRWDWTRIYYSDCFITNPYYVSRALLEEDCNVCESLERLDRLANVSSLVVSEDYLKNDVPFIVTDAMEDWPVMNTDDFWFDNVTEMYLGEELKGVYPCELTSNLRLRPDDLRTFLKKIHNPDIHRWYGHWENCNKKAAKALRQLYRRPYFIPHMVDLSDSNWVLISSDFKGKVYKEVNFQTELLWVGQVRGWSRIRLVPREPCDSFCPELLDDLLEGQMVIVTNMLWKFEYIPGEHTDNLAVAVGGFWT
ncbi:uncharacterized protein LOC123508815 [Portunus trituberculatus]|uniref:uncharacterized protein LOC123508815 n=1 Tax=Portunus trituberculatus TaxID=210409 RepID=UPI001E1CF2AD|nr:uncharacterized protein LOC123508815 [Portunus trituberculatus]